VALVVLLIVTVNAVEIPEEHVTAVDDLMVMMQEENMPNAPQVNDMDPEQFSELMNRIISRASKMRGVMNKLGISDKDSVQAVEEHFLKLGKAHRDLGEGDTTDEDLRVHGLKARSCVKHATKCSGLAATCHGESPVDCNSVVASCSRAGAACGLTGIGESVSPKDTKKKVKASKPQDDKKQKQKQGEKLTVAKNSLKAHTETKKKKKPIRSMPSKTGQQPPAHEDEDDEELIEDDESSDDAENDAADLLDEQLALISFDAEQEMEQKNGDY